jgi:hypothetical protein
MIPLSDAPQWFPCHLDRDRLPLEPTSGYRVPVGIYRGARRGFHEHYRRKIANSPKVSEPTLALGRCQEEPWI